VGAVDPKGRGAYWPLSRERRVVSSAQTPDRQLDRPLDVIPVIPVTCRILISSHTGEINLAHRHSTCSSSFPSQATLSQPPPSTNRHQSVRHSSDLPTAWSRGNIWFSVFHSVSLLFLFFSHSHITHRDRGVRQRQLATPPNTNTSTVHMVQDVSSIFQN
jgi:hypothetical protein